MPIDPRNSTNAFKILSDKDRQGGGLHFQRDTYYPILSNRYVSSVNYPDGYKPFRISIYDSDNLVDLAQLTLIVNPIDISFGNVNIQNSSYSREGWITTLWGRQQSTISTNGGSAGFYYDSNVTQALAGEFNAIHEGLVNYNRKNSIEFINILTLIAMFKNNGYYHLNNLVDQTMFRDGTGRVIHVMDQIRINYDNTDYFGSFSSFTLDENADNPYRLNYNFEYIVSGLNNSISEGHIHSEGNEQNRKVEIAVQGSTLLRKFQLSEEELNQDFKIENVPSFETQDGTYSFSELEDEFVYYKNLKAVKVPDNTVRVTRGGLDNESHDNKIDYRTASSNIHSFYEGTVYKIKGNDPNYDAPRASHYIIIRSQVSYFQGPLINNPVTSKDVFIRYYHMKPGSMPNKKTGDTISQGEKIGKEGTDGGAYIQHCDLEVRLIPSGNVSWDSAGRINAKEFFEKGIVQLCEKGLSDYKKVIYKHGKKGTPFTDNTFQDYPVCSKSNSNGSNTA